MAGNSVSSTAEEAAKRAEEARAAARAIYTSYSSNNSVQQAAQNSSVSSDGTISEEQLESYNISNSSAYNSTQFYPLNIVAQPKLNDVEYLYSKQKLIEQGLKELGGDKMNSGVLSALSRGLIEYFPNNNLSKDGINNLIDVEFKSYLNNLGISYTDSDLADAKTVLNGLYEYGAYKDGDASSMTLTDFVKEVSEYSGQSYKNDMEYLTSNQDLITQGLGELGGDKMNSEVLKSLTKGLIEYLPNNRISKGDIDNVIDVEFKSYLNNLGVPYTDSDLANAKIVLNNLIDGSAAKDGDSASMSLADFASILNEYELNLAKSAPTANEYIGTPSYVNNSYLTQTEDTNISGSSVETAAIEDVFNPNERITMFDVVSDGTYQSKILAHAKNEITQCDSDGDGKMNLSEFKYCMRHFSSVISEEEMESLFKSLSSLKFGDSEHITEKEVAAILCLADLDIDEYRNGSSTMLSYLDGGFTKQEFVSASKGIINQNAAMLEYLNIIHDQVL